MFYIDPLQWAQSSEYSSVKLQSFEKKTKINQNTLFSGLTLINYLLIFQLKIKQNQYKKDFVSAFGIPGQENVQHAVTAARKYLKLVHGKYLKIVHGNFFSNQTLKMWLCYKIVLYRKSFSFFNFCISFLFFIFCCGILQLLSNITTKKTLVLQSIKLQECLGFHLLALLINTKIRYIILYY